VQLLVRGVMVSAAVDGGKLVGYFNLPWFAWGSAEMNLGDTAVYDTHVRVTSPYDRLATAIIKLFVHYKVRPTICLYRCIMHVSFVYRAMLRRLRLCHNVSSVCPSVRDFNVP